LSIHSPTLAAVRDVAAHMRAPDREEIWPLWWDPSPEKMAEGIMSRPQFCWIAAKDGVPTVVFGAIEYRPKAWNAFAFGTDAFESAAPEMTKFLLRKVKPHLFNELGAVRIEAYSHGDHKTAHRWLELLGAKGTPDPEFGPDGQTYIHFVMRRSDFIVTQGKRRPTIVASECAFDAGGTPNFASSADTTPDPKHVP
jgi:hypothetical protein